MLQHVEATVAAVAFRGEFGFALYLVLWMLALAFAVMRKKRIEQRLKPRMVQPRRLEFKWA